MRILTPLFALTLALLISCSTLAQPQTAFEKSGGTETFTYEEGIGFCKTLDSISPYFKLESYGRTDAGFPLHVLVFDADQNFVTSTSKPTLMINNAIHPGEPDGVEASLMLARDIAYNDELRAAWSKVRMIIIPFYNIGGARNRNTASRANQVGPKEYGFRGNAQNLDLNRDFIKADAFNTLAFYQIFHLYKPDVFVDNHVSNGADYAHTLTLINSQEEKYDEHVGKLLKDHFLPDLYESMKEQEEWMVPYVNIHGSTPDSGYHAFLASPRYTNGYVQLFDCIGLVVETHMLKPFDQRVKATYKFLNSLGPIMKDYDFKFARWQDALARSSAMESKFLLNVPIGWDYLPDSMQGKILFKGYQAEMVKSEVSGAPRLKYDREQPWTDSILYADAIIPTKVTALPKAFIIPPGYHRVLDLLTANGIKYDRLKKDSIMDVTMHHIQNLDTRPQPYEGHYLHTDIDVLIQGETIEFPQHSAIVWVTPENAKFLAHVLEPRCEDSYFAWNFFDAILQQKEWYSAYVFEDEAAAMMKDPQYKEEINNLFRRIPNLRENPQALLYELYKLSPHYEKVHMRYPIGFLY